MTFKTASKHFVASTAIFAALLGPAISFAQEVTPVTETSADIVVSAVVMAAELAELKTREADPSTGFVTRFFLRIKIKEIENKLNIATALK